MAESSPLPGEASPELRVHCLDCDEVDFSIRMSAIGIKTNLSGASSRTDDILEEMLEDELECTACGGSVVIDEVDGDG